MAKDSFDDIEFERDISEREIITNRTYQKYTDIIAPWNVEVRLRLDASVGRSLKQLSERLMAIAQVPLPESGVGSEFGNLLKEWQASVGQSLMRELQGMHRESYTGTSYHTIRHYAGRSNKSYTGRWELIGYMPRGEELQETPEHQKAMVYWGGFSRASTSVFEGSRMLGHVGVFTGGGLAPGAIPNISNDGAIRLGRWALAHGHTLKPATVSSNPSGRRHHAGVHWGRPSSGGLKQQTLLKKLAWAIIAEMNAKGMEGDDTFKQFETEFAPNIISSGIKNLESQLTSFFTRTKQTD